MKVLVTGANGYIASFIVQDLLKHGYKVRGTVRSLQDTSKYSHLNSFENAAHSLEIVEADLLKEGSFDEHVIGCQIVMHTASPFFIPSADLDPQKVLIEPALQGTRNVLNAVEKQRHSVKRVIVTSSTAAILSVAEKEIGRVYTEKDWNEKSSLTNSPYAYSKTLAEREAWKMWDDMKQKYATEEGELFDLSVVNPTLVTGPLLQSERLKQYGVKELNTSCAIVRNIVLKQKLNSENGNKIKANEGWTFIDVRDVAKIHRLVMETPGAGGSRFVSVAGKNTWAKLIPVFAEHFPEYKDTMPNEIEGDIEEGYKELACYSTENLEKTLPAFDGWISVEQSLLDTIQSLKDNGLLE